MFVKVERDSILVRYLPSYLLRNSDWNAVCFQVGLFLHNSQYTSTSPEVEKPGYVQKTRETFKFMLSNPMSRMIFPNTDPHIYHLEDGKWKMK